MNQKVQVNGIDLSNLTACFITLRAWKLDGRCSELCVKAHALKGQPCVHQRLIIGDGFVSITEGFSIKSFFEHAEDVEEEEDDFVDKYGNELDGEDSRPRKHAKSPELAREFLLDSATIIFKEQVEKAFREGTARQNANSLFVSLAMKLLEERLHVSFREIITLEKQIKLLEEEENEKREDEGRKERRRNKERERKLRRKERQKEKEKDREVKPVEPKSPSIGFSASANNLPANANDKSSKILHDSGDTICNLRVGHTPMGPILADITDDNSATDSINLQNHRLCFNHVDGESHFRENTGSFMIEQSKSSRWRLRVNRDKFDDQAPNDKRKSALSTAIRIQHDESYMKQRASSRYSNGRTHAFGERIVRMNSRNCNMRSSDKFQSPRCRVHDRNDSQPHRCNEPGEYRLSDCRRFPTTRLNRELNRYSKTTYGCNSSENYFIRKGKLVTGASGREATHTRQVWEPMDSQNKYSRGNLGVDISSRTKEIKFHKNEEGRQKFENTDDSSKAANISNSTALRNCQNRFLQSEKSPTSSKEIAEECNSSSNMSKFSKRNCCHSMMISSSSDCCSSCLSEGDSSFSSSGTLIAETSSTSDLEDISHQSSCNRDVLHKKQDKAPDIKIDKSGNSSSGFPIASDNSDSSSFTSDVTPPHQNVLQAHSYLPMPIFPREIMYYQNQNSISWSFSQHGHYMAPPPIGSGLPANRALELSIQYNTLKPPITTTMFSFPQHHLYHGKTRVYAASPKEQITNSIYADDHVNKLVSEPSEKSSGSQKCAPELPSSGKNWIGKSSMKKHEGSQSFSLFHFGGPLVDASEYCVSLKSMNEPAGPILNTMDSQSGIACSIEETKMEEYSLFAEGNSSRQALWLRRIPTSSSTRLRPSISG